jgi:hypothetical protein
MSFDLPAHTLLLAVGGSRAYGMHTEASDVDVKGVALPPRAWLLGGLRRFEQADGPGQIGAFAPLLRDDERQIAARTKLEGVVYHLHKLALLALDANPNILDVLFCRDAELRLARPLGLRLREARRAFVSARARHTFGGYALAQLKRIRHHRGWLLNPPRGKPTRADFGLPEQTLLPADHLAALRAAVQKQLDLWEPNLASLPLSDRVAVQAGLADYLEQFCAALPEGLVDPDERVAGARFLAAARHIGVSDKLIWVLQREREYEAAMRGYKQYTEWERSRNPERAALEAQHGYDTKHGAHLVRLLRMGREVLEQGEVFVWRGPDGGPGDADELRAIRAGAWGYDRLEAWAEAERAALDAAVRPDRCRVPAEPDREAVERLVVGIVDDALAGGLGA